MKSRILATTVVVGLLFCAVSCQTQEAAPQNGSCISFTVSTQDFGTPDAFWIALGDLDDDDDLDAFMLDGQASATVHMNDGTGYFTDSGQSLGQLINHGIALGDLDDDEDLDAFLVHNSGADWVLFNDGTGTFTDSGQRLGGDEWGTTVTLGDLDGDEDLDAFVGQYMHENRIWFNDGQGGFDSCSFFGGTESGRMCPGDVDGDHDLDIVLSNSSAYDEVWLNDGAGNLVDSGQNIGLSTGRGTPALGDLDGDEDLDIFTVNTEQGCRVWLNDGAGTFTAYGSRFGAQTSKVELVDLDGDKDLDAITSHYQYGNYVWENDGTAVFDSLGPMLATSGGVSTPSGDVDGDGDRDVFLCGLEDNPTKLYFNTSCTTGIEESDALLPGLVLLGSDPNPFSSVTRITYNVSVPGRVLLTVYDVQGRKVRTLVDEFRSRGVHSAEFEARDLASGVYLYRLIAGRTARSGSMLLAR